VFQAQRHYAERLTSIAAELQAGVVAAPEATLRIQGALAEFAVESGLAKIYKEWSAAALEKTMAGAGGARRAG
jgi:hypothetical protein